MAPAIVAASLLAACSGEDLDRMFPPSRSAPGGFEPVPPSGPGASEETTERMPIDDSAPSAATPPAVKPSGATPGAPQAQPNAAPPGTHTEIGSADSSGGPERRRNAFGRFDFGFDVGGVVLNQKFSVAGSSAGTASTKNGDFQFMPMLDVGYSHRIGGGFSGAINLKVGLPDGQGFSATQMTTGGFSALYKSEMDGPVFAPNAALGYNLGHGIGRVTGSVGAWAEQYDMSVQLSQPGFTETFTSDKYIIRPFGGIGYLNRLPIGERLRVELMGQVYWIGSGGNLLLSGGNALSSASVAFHDQVAIFLGLRFKCDD
jgi:hypothetical protein